MHTWFSSGWDIHKQPFFLIRCLLRWKKHFVHIIRVMSSAQMRPMELGAYKNIQYDENDWLCGKSSILVVPLICPLVKLENSLVCVQDKNKTNLVSCAWCGEILDQNSIALHCWFRTWPKCFSRRNPKQYLIQERIVGLLRPNCAFQRLPNDINSYITHFELETFLWTTIS